MRNVAVSYNILNSEYELMDALRSSMHDERYNDLVIMAGHFMLFFDSVSKRLVPGIFEEIQNDLLKTQVKERVGVFPSYTWDLGVKLGDHYRENHRKPAKLLLLINDWQYVPDGGKASDFRSDFYEGFDGLPAGYAERLATSRHLSENDLLASRKHSIAFPETWLKYRFQKSAAKLVKAGALEKRYLDDRPGQSEVSFTDSSGNSLPLISCGVTGCAGEVTEMISEVHKSGGRYIIIFAPGECHAPVRTGVEIALSLYQLRNMKVLIADPGGSGEMSHDEIFETGVNLTVFQS